MSVKELLLGIPVTKSGNFDEYEKAIEWYRSVLGFTLNWKMGIASLKLANGQEILLFGEEDDEESIWYTGNVQQNPHYSVQFRTDQIDDLRLKLVASGVQVGEVHVIPGGPGDRILKFCDPYGNRFWAIEEPKGRR